MHRESIVGVQRNLIFGRRDLKLSSLIINAVTLEQVLELREVRNESGDSHLPAAFWHAMAAARGLSKLTFLERDQQLTPLAFSAHFLAEESQARLTSESVVTHETNQRIHTKSGRLRGTVWRDKGRDSHWHSSSVQSSLRRIGRVPQPQMLCFT